MGDDDDDTTTYAITRGDSGRMRRNRFGSQALKLVQRNLVMPFWAPFPGSMYSAQALERWGLAELRLIKTPEAARQKKPRAYYARLTPQGIKVRDDYARLMAERASRREHTHKRKRRC